MPWTCVSVSVLAKTVGRCMPRLEGLLGWRAGPGPAAAGGALLGSAGGKRREEVRSIAVRCEIVEEPNTLPIVLQRTLIHSQLNCDAVTLIRCILFAHVLYNGSGSQHCRVDVYTIMQHVAFVLKHSETGRKKHLFITIRSEGVCTLLARPPCRSSTTCMYIDRLSTDLKNLASMLLCLVLRKTPQGNLAVTN